MKIIGDLTNSQRRKKLVNNFFVESLRGGSQITFASLGGWVVQILKKLQTL